MKPKNPDLDSGVQNRFRNMYLLDSGLDRARIHLNCFYRSNLFEDRYLVDTERITCLCTKWVKLMNEECM